MSSRNANCFPELFCIFFLSFAFRSIHPDIFYGTHPCAKSISPSDMSISCIARHPWFKNNSNNNKTTTIYWVFIMSGSMPSALNVFPPKEDLVTYLWGRYIILIFPERKTRLWEIEWQNQNLTLGLFGFLETHCSLKGKIVQSWTYWEQQSRSYCLTWKNETFIW